jgi:hypothetical protein
MAKAGNARVQTWLQQPEQQKMGFSMRPTKGPPLLNVSEQGDHVGIGKLLKMNSNPHFVEWNARLF